MAVGIVTVLYGSEAVLEEFFQALEAQTFRDFFLICVNNRSPDASLKMATHLSRMVSFETVLIDLDDNYGVAKGNNVGLELARKRDAESVIVANNDVALDPKAIEYLVATHREQNADIVAPKILFYDTGYVWYAGGDYDRLRIQTIHFGYLKPETLATQRPGHFPFAPTCFCLLSKKVLKAVGPMDESFFVYADDTDFMLRANKLGYDVFYEPRSVVRHKESTSTGGRLSSFSIEYLNRNKIKLIRKHFSLGTKIVSICYILLIHIPKELPKLNKAKRRAFLRGLARGLFE